MDADAYLAILVAILFCLLVTWGIYCYSGAFVG